MPKKETVKASSKVKTVKNTSKNKLKQVVSPEPVYQDVRIPLNTSAEAATAYPLNKQFKLLIVAIVVLTGIVSSAYFLRDYYLAAWVNNRPIFRYKLNQEMTKAVGADILENMIIQELVDQETRKSNIVVTAEKLKQEIDKITESLGAGTSLEDALKFQGTSMADFEKQVSTRIQINELLGKEVSVSAEEIDQFVQDNAAILTATGVAEKRNEAEVEIRNQKITAKIQEWIKTLQDKAQITRFLK